MLSVLLVLPECGPIAHFFQVQPNIKEKTLSTRSQEQSKFYVL